MMFSNFLLSNIERSKVEKDFPVAQTVETLTMMQTRVLSLGWEVLLEKGMTTHSSILAWRIPWTEKPGGLLSVGSQRVRHDRGTNTQSRVWFVNKV